VTEGQEPEVQATQLPEAPPDVEEEKGAAAVAELAALRQELETTKAKECEYLNGWQRSRAELANARKRFQREQEQAYANAQADVLVRLLPVLDDLERAFETLPHNLSGLTWIGGVLLIQRKLQLLLEQAGVTPVEALGKEFDPFAHEAVTHEPSETFAEGQVISELQKGYRLGERILRPAMVRVSSGPPPAAQAEPDTPEGEGA
jgi:molecular chaperone GrpE